ncbi:MAG: peptidase C45 [Bacteroidales bacterium]|nr:peptidase C45 [Bacteroidales bacterium]
MNRLLITSLVLSFILASCTSPSSQKSTLTQEQILAKASRTEKNGWIKIHLEGTPDVIGFQHGYLLAEEIIDLRGAMEVRNLHFTGRDRDFYRNESYRILWHNIPVEYQAELNGIVAGVNARLGEGKIDIKDIVAINSLLEIPDYYVPWLENQEKPTPAEHCSAIAATGSWTTDGKIVMAHNNWSEYLIGERWNILLDIVPEKGNRIFMDALPGFIHSGDDFNINSAGLIVTETTISGFKGFDTTGVAEFVRARKAVQYGSSIDEWVAIMVDRNNGGYANAWLLGDNKTGEIARLELGLKNHFLERTTDGVFTGANFPVNEKILKEETTFDATSPEKSANMRRLRWDVLMKEYKGKIDIEAAKSFMGDHYDMNRKQEKAGRFSLCGHLDEDEKGVPEVSWDGAYFAAGAVQAKATDGKLAARMQLWAIMGHPCGRPFIAKSFLDAHPEYNIQKDYLRDMPGQVWTLFEE